jgi:uncharacterized protein YjiS (DUF1127 family)
VRFENHFHGGRSSRLLVLRRNDAAIFGAGKKLAARSEGAGQYSHRQIHRAVIQDPPGGSDGSFRTSSNWPWRAVSAAISISITKAAGVVGACGELRLCRVLDAVVSWIFEQAFEGCAAYAAAMYGIPVGELRDRHDPADDPQTAREHTDRLVSRPPGEISANVKGNILCLAESRIARLEAEFVAPPQRPRMASPGWVASISSIVAKIRSRIRRLRDRRLAATELRSFDDRSLRDVGISRCDIEYLVRHGDRRE